MVRTGCRARMLVLSLFVASAPAQAADPPKRVLIIVLDQFRPDYVNTFEMNNVKQLMHDGVSFDNAYLGHMASETVITHNVITSGQLPKDMGWGDEAYRDTDEVLSDAEGDVDLGLARARRLQQADRARGLLEARRLPARRPTRARSSSPPVRRTTRCTRPTGRRATSR